MKRSRYGAGSKTSVTGRPAHRASSPGSTVPHSAAGSTPALATNRRSRRSPLSARPGSASATRPSAQDRLSPIPTASRSQPRRRVTRTPGLIPIARGGAL